MYACVRADPRQPALQVVDALTAQRLIVPSDKPAVPLHFDTKVRAGGSAVLCGMVGFVGYCRVIKVRAGGSGAVLRGTVWRKHLRRPTATVRRRKCNAALGVRR